VVVIYLDRRETLDRFSLWCPVCSNKTMRILLDNCKFIVCEDFNCDYFKLDEIIHEKGASEHEKEKAKKSAIKKFKNIIIDQKQQLIDKKHQLLKKTQTTEMETEENMNLILKMIEENRKEKEGIDLIKEEREARRQAKRIRRDRIRYKNQRKRRNKIEERDSQKKEEIRKKKLEKIEKIRKSFQSKYKSLFGNGLLDNKKINSHYFSDEEVKIGLKEYEKEQIRLNKEIQAKKDQEKRNMLRKTMERQ
jgi:hypothetical protein